MARKHVLLEGNDRSSRCCVVRHEARARELFSVASLRGSTSKAKGNQISACKEGDGPNRPKSQGLDLKPDDLLVGRMKSSFKGMEVRIRCWTNHSGDLRVGVISYSYLVIAGSF